MQTRRTFLNQAFGMALVLGLSSLGGCGWTPLYADLETGPADAELRAIKVAPIPERIGQNLALALRQSLNPTGEPTPQRYLLRTTLQTVRQDLGVQTQGLGTRGRLDAIASFFLSDSKSGAQLLTGTSHVANRSISLPMNTPTSSPKTTPGPAPSRNCAATSRAG